MRIRIATKAWNGSVAATGEDVCHGVQMPWVELDGVRTSDVLSATVEAGNQATHVTITFIAAAEMVLLDADGQIIPQPEEPT